MKSESLANFCPIFIVGNSRSGTTLMGRILNCHPEVFTFEELHFFEELWSSNSSGAKLHSEDAIELAAQLIDIQRNGYLTRGNPQDFISEAKDIVQKLSTSADSLQVFAAFLDYESPLNKKTRPCEQTPRNVLYIGEILTTYPQARIINMIRDPRDILLSQKRRWRRPFLSDNIPKKEAIRYWLNYHSITISKLWNVNVQAAEGFLSDERVCEIHFEELLKEPESTVEKVCQFLDLSFDPGLLDVPQVGSSNTPDRPEIKGIDKQKLQNWQQGGLNSVEIFLCQKINQNIMAKHGYSLESTSINPFLLMLSLVAFPLKLSLALLFNLKRMGNLTEAIKKRLGR